MEQLFYTVKTLFRKQGFNCHETLNILDGELEDLENKLRKFDKYIKIIEKGVEPIEKDRDKAKNKLASLEKRLFNCFKFEDDKLVMDKDKLLKEFEEEASEYLCS